MENKLTKKQLRLIGKLWAAVILINCEGGFSSDEVTEDTTEDQLDIIVKEAIRQGDKILRGHHSARGLGTIAEIAEYVKSI